jgi:hypothetical protein
VDDAIAAVISALDAENPALAADALAAWEALIAMSPPAGPTQATVQQYCWAALYQRDTYSAEENWNLAQALAAVFTRLGRPRYAQIAGGDTTRRLLFIEDPEEWYQQYCAALDSAGVEPPDTDLVTWQDFATPGEIEIIDEIAGTLEVAAIAGEFGIGERASRTRLRRKEITDAVLRTQRNGQPLLETLLDHRIDLWSRYSAPRAEMYAGLEEQLHAAVQPAPGAVARAHGLLRIVGEGVHLTEAGYLPPAFVERAIRELWTDADWPFPARNELSARPLLTLRHVLQHVRVLRKHKGTLVPTSHGRNLSREGLWNRMVQRWVGTDYRPETLIAEAVLAAVARGESPSRAARVAPGEGSPDATAYVRSGDEIAMRAAALIGAEGWRYGGEAVAGQDVVPILESVLKELYALGLLQSGGTPTADGMAFAAAVLRYRLLHTAFPQQHGS